MGKRFDDLKEVLGRFGDDDIKNIVERTNGYEVFYMEDLDSEVSNRGARDFIKEILDSEYFDLDDNYFYYDDYGIRSFDDYSVEFDIDDFADSIIDNDNDCGYEEIREILDKDYNVFKKIDEVLDSKDDFERLFKNNIYLSQEVFKEWVAKTTIDSIELLNKMVVLNYFINNWLDENMVIINGKLKDTYIKYDEGLDCITDYTIYGSEDDEDIIF